MKEQLERYSPKADFEAFYHADEEACTVAAHRHDFYEMLFFIEGDVTYVVDGHPYPLREGDLLVIPPGAQHYAVFGEARPFRRVLLWLTADLVRSLERGERLLECFPGKGGSCFYRFSPEEGALLLERAVAAAEEFNASRPFGDTMALLLVTELLILLHRMMPASAQSRPEAGPSERLVPDVVDFINENLSRELTLDYIADHFFLSKFYLSRVFKHYMKITPHSYITQRRLALARGLLCDGVPPTEVCRRCGYADYSSFYRAFREKYGVSPKHLCLREGKDGGDKQQGEMRKVFQKL